VVDIAARVRKLIIADDMGLGKTGAAISAVQEWRLRNPLEDGTGDLPEGPKLVVAPNSVKGTWRRELGLWLGKDEPFQIVDGNTPKARHDQLESAIAADGWCIVNWEQLRVKKQKVEIRRRNGAIGAKTIEVMKEPLFESTPWLAVIADEAHRAKNRKAQTTRGLWRTRADSGLMFAMTGTPLMNSPAELWAILHWLWPKEYTSYWRFDSQYVDSYEAFMGGRKVQVITGVRNPDALRFELKDRLVRRTQGMVLDLPGKVRIPVPIELGPKQRKLYAEAESQMWLKVQQEVEQGDKDAEAFAKAVLEGVNVYQIPNGAARTVRLRMILESPALLGGEDDSAVLDACVDRVVDSQPIGGREQWVVFTEFADTPDLLAKRFEAKGLVAKTYTGRISTDVRAKLEEQFQRGEIDVLIGTIKSMYQGITLTASNKQFWVSRDWVPDINEQGEDRQNRIGQSDRVFVFIAQPEDTVATSKIEPLNRLKERIVRAVVPKDNIDYEKEVA
jgi:SNF2 family DNA or RNA helicase